VYLGKCDSPLPIQPNPGLGQAIIFPHITITFSYELYSEVFEVNFLYLIGAYHLVVISIKLLYN
jgi:hypothetical protein